MFYQMQVECLYCEKNFETTKVKSSKAKVVKRDSDFCIHYDGPNPLFYDIFLCPHCGFAFYNSYRKLSDANKKKLKELYISKVSIKDMGGVRTIDEAIHAFKLALLTSSIINERKFVTANLALKLGWLYRMLGNEEQELRFLTLALDDYVYMMANENIEQEGVDEDKLMYLMADLNARLDRYVEARRLFSYLMTEKKVSPKYKTLAIDRWNEYKEQLE